MIKNINKTKLFTVAILVLAVALGATLSAVSFASADTATVKGTSATTYDAGKEYYASDYKYLEDKNSVYQSLTYEEAVYLFQQEGNYLILLGGSWCGNTTAVIDYVNDVAKESGVSTIYNLDFRLDGTSSNSHIRETNGSSADGSHYNFLYGELVTRYLTNLNDWVEYKEDGSYALTYTNVDGQNVKVAKAQVPFLFLYNKDNAVNNLGESEDGKTYPIVYGYEKMLTRAKDGSGLNGTTVEAYKQELKDNVFSHIGDGAGQLKLSQFTDADYIRLAYNDRSGQKIFEDDEQINIKTLTYKQLLWLLEQEGDYLILFGGAWCGNTQAVIDIINDYAVANNVTVYNFDTKLDGGYAKAKWGYKSEVHIRDNNNEFVKLYVDLVSKYLTNIETEYKIDSNNNIFYQSDKNDESTKVVVNKLQVPYFFAYNKDAENNDGHDTPILKYVEKMYSRSESRNDYIGKEENYLDYTSRTFSVIKAYAESTNTEAKDVVAKDDANSGNDNAGNNGGNTGNDVISSGDTTPSGDVNDGNKGGSNNTLKIVFGVIGAVAVIAIVVAIVVVNKKKTSGGSADEKQDKQE